MINLRNVEKALQTLNQVVYERQGEIVIARHPLVQSVEAEGRDPDEAQFNLRFELSELKLEMISLQ